MSENCTNEKIICKVMCNSCQQYRATMLERVSTFIINYGPKCRVIQSNILFYRNSLKHFQDRRTKNFKLVKLWGCLAWCGLLRRDIHMSIRNATHADIYNAVYSCFFILIQSILYALLKVNLYFNLNKNKLAPINQCNAVTKS